MDFVCTILRFSGTEEASSLLDSPPAAACCRRRIFARRIAILAML
jgi:hypothetical protein